jgi:radical SAM family uncharacterized protein/radical SAM-linked protein
MNTKIASQLERVLPRVDSPARYLGGEANSVHKDPELVEASIVLVFPDTYEIGMSNNGMKVLYHVVNQVPQLLAETAFAPWTDMGDLMKAEGIPLYSHQSYKPVREFDMIGITLQSELNFSNVPYVLDLAGVPVWSRDRSESDPFVIGGGPSMSNPEPIADFFDLFCIGDGEKLVPLILEMTAGLKKANTSRSQILKSLSAVEGVYVPALVDVIPDEKGMPVPAQPAKGSYLKYSGVKRTWIPFMDPADYPIQNLIPNTPPVHSRFAVEVMRGCTNGCRFCQAGYWYRPNRELNVDAVIDIAKKGLKATGERQLGLLSLSSADYVPIEKVTDIIMDQPEFANVDTSLPSLRANSFGQSLAIKAAAIKGGRSATFAPETGSERLRKMINKTISDQDMLDAAEGVFKAGFNKIKLYTMVGLPTENMEDMEAFCGLIEALVQVARKYGGRKQIHADIGIFIPKAWTPMQWSSFMDRETTMSHIRFVRERFYHNQFVRISWQDWELSHLEAFYSSGGRNLAPMILEASRRGLVFESFREKFSYEGWQKVWSDFNYNPDWVHDEKSKEQVFPWEFMHIGVTRGYLWTEYQKMFDPQSEPVPDCKYGDCQHCGIPGNGEDTQLSTPNTKYDAPSRTPKEIKAKHAALIQEDRDVYHYRFSYAKTGLSRYLPHRNTLDIFERALMRIGVNLNYSRGFSPKPKIHNAGALPLGLQSLCEMISIETREPLNLNEKSTLIREINQIFPHGVRVLDISLQKKSDLPRPLAIEFQLEKGYDAATIFKRYCDEGPQTLVDHKGRTISCKDEIVDLKVIDNKIAFTARTNTTGNAVSPFILIAGILGITENESRQLSLVKTKLHLELEPVNG